jgi:hypothetical protein
VRCLLNPRLQLGGLVHIDSSLLSGVPYIPGTAAQTDAQGNIIGGNLAGGINPNISPMRQVVIAPYTSPTGTYKILMMNYHGDTRGQPWYCELTCLALGSDNKVLNSPNSVWGRASSEARSFGIGSPTGSGGT